jgi:hypothetical protein
LQFSSTFGPLGVDDYFVRLDFSIRTPTIWQTAVVYGVADVHALLLSCRLLHVSLSGVTPDSRMLFCAIAFLSINP